MVLEIILWIIRFFFGAGIFSFLHIVIDKLTYGKSAICAKSKRIARYFLVELTGGVSMTGCAIVYGCGKMGVISLRGAVFFIYLGILFVIALVDWHIQMIYDRFHIMILILAILDFMLYPEMGIATRLTGMGIISVPMLVLALAIPGAFGGGDIKLDGIGILAGVINGVGVALQILLPKYFAKDYERDTLLVYGFLGAAVVLMFGMDFGAVSSHMSSTPTGVLLWNLFGIGILCTMVANVSCVKSTQYVEATTTSILSALEVVVGILVGFVVFHEHMTMLQILGAVIIVVGAIGSEIYQPKRVEKDYGRVK